MSKERISIKDGIVAEAETVKKLVDQGLYDQISPEEFPLLGKDPVRLTSLQVQAMGNWYYELNNRRLFVRRDNAAYLGISAEMGKLVEAAVEKIKAVFPLETSSDKVSPIFWMSQEEKISLENAISLGLPSTVNKINFPSLAAASEKDILRFQLRAYDFLVNEWNSYLKGGLSNHADKGDEGLIELAKKEIKSAKREKEKLIRKINLLS